MQPGKAPYPTAGGADGYQPAGASQYPPVRAEFDAGARFKPYAPGSIPPPPPGYAPNAAQAAAASGMNVTATQKKGGFFKGSGSGGFTFW